MAGTLAEIATLSFGILSWLFGWSWQVLVLLGVAWLAVKCDRRAAAESRYRVWLLAAAAGSIVPGLIALAERVPLPAARAATLLAWPTMNMRELAPATLQAVQPALDRPSLIWPILVAVWAAGVGASLVKWASSLGKLRRVRAQSREVSLTDLDCSGLDIAAGSGAPILLSDQIRSPGLTGLLHPAILLPADIVSWTSRGERAAIIQHELAHIRRRDHVVSFFQSVLKALLFYHPMVRYASNQLDLQRELACDDRVLALGTEPRAYAESILKVLERSFLADTVHQSASFVTKKTLERRITMILDRNRLHASTALWRSLLLPATLIILAAGLLIAAGRERPVPEEPPAAAVQNPSAPAASGPRVARGAVVIDPATIWIDTVKFGTMALQVRGTGVLVRERGGRLKVELQIDAAQAPHVAVGQAASIQLEKAVFPGSVAQVGAAGQGGMVTVEVALENDLLAAARPGAKVNGVIQFGRAESVLYVGRPVNAPPDSTGSLFKLDADGKTLTRTTVRFGRSSISTIEILDGLHAGDKVILSDVSAYDGVDALRLP